MTRMEIIRLIILLLFTGYRNAFGLPRISAYRMPLTASSPENVKTVFCSGAVLEGGFTDGEEAADLTFGVCTDLCGFAEVCGRFLDTTGLAGAAVCACLNSCSCVCCLFCCSAAVFCLFITMKTVTNKKTKKPKSGNSINSIDYLPFPSVGAADLPIALRISVSEMTFFML